MVDKLDTTEIVVKLVQHTLSGPYSTVELIGSRYFGWDNEKSDFDFLVLYEGDEIFNTIAGKLKAIRMLTDLESPYPFKHYRADSPWGQIDLCFTRNREEFYALVEEHQRLKLCYEKHPNLNELAMLLHAHGVSGAKRYQIVRDFAVYRNGSFQPL
mgnify:CR=1 FL=1